MARAVDGLEVHKDIRKEAPCQGGRPAVHAGVRLVHDHVAGRHAHVHRFAGVGVDLHRPSTQSKQAF